MTRADRIIRLLTEKLQPSVLELRDDSHKHAGHGGSRPEGQTHYELVIESPHFKGISPVARHQLVYGLLEAEFKDGLHALSIKASAPKH